MKLRYYSEFDLELTKAYDHAVGFDCKPMTMKIRFEDDYLTPALDCQRTQGIRDILLTMILHRESAGQATKITHLIFDTGIHLEPEDGKFWVMACANSRVVKTDFVLQNGVGIIDPDYRGSVKFFYASMHPSTDLAFLYKFIPSCGQLVPIIGDAGSVVAEKVDKLEDLSSTERGEKGFGSSAKNS